MGLEEEGAGLSSLNLRDEERDRSSGLEGAEPRLLK